MTPLKDALFPIHYVEIAESLVRARGGQVGIIYEQCGVRPEDLLDSGNVIDGLQLKRILDIGLQYCLPGEPISMQILRHFPLTAFGTLGMLVITSETICDGLEAALTYHALVVPGFEMHREFMPGGVRVRLERVIDFGIYNDLLTELVIGIFPNIAPYAMVKDLSMEVQFKHQTPGGQQHYSDFFGAPVEFGAQQDAFFIANATLQHRLLTSNRATCAALQTLLLRQAGAALQHKPITQHVRRILAVSLKGGSLPCAEQIASELAVSSRTLSRRLQEEGVTLNSLIEHVRIERAERLLLTTARPVSEVARSAGFQDASSFSRAFKRVTGATPNELRERTGSTEHHDSATA